MSDFLSLFPPKRRRNLLLVLIAVLVILLVLAIIGTPAPKIATTFGGATVDLRADRAWVLVPGQCVAASWNLEGIKSLYIDGEGKIGWGEESYCPSLEATSPIIEISAANGETRSFVLGVHYLPADVIHSLALMALLAPFVAAIYYVAVPRLEQPIPLNISLLLAFVALFLLCLILQSFRAFTLVSILDGLGDIFVSPAWQVFGLVLAGLVFIPLVIQETWKGVKRGAWADFIVIAAFMIFVLLLFLPFGFESIGQQEEWVLWAYLEGRPSRMSQEVLVRFWLLVIYPLANAISSDSFAGFHLVNLFQFWGKLVLLYVIFRQLKVSPLTAFIMTMLFVVYPVNDLLMSSRSYLVALSMLGLMAAISLVLIHLRKPSRLRLVGILLALLLNVGSYEAGYAFILVVPISWWWHSPRLTWRNVNMTAIWYLMPTAKLLYVLILSGASLQYYGTQYISRFVEQQRSALEHVSHYSGIIGNVYRQTFVYGWQEAFGTLGQNLWIAPTLVSIVLVAAVSLYLMRGAKPTMFPSRRQLGVWLVSGLLFVMPSIGVLMWFEKYQRELWRMYIYVPIGAAAAVISFLLLILSSIKRFRLRQAIFICLCLLLMFPAVSRLYVQHSYFVNSANAKAKVLLQIVEQAPSLDSKARLMLVTDMAFNDLDAAGIRELWTNMFDSAVFMLYQEVRPKVAFLCVLGERCSTDDIDVREKYLKNGTDYSDFVMFRLYDDLSVELLRQLPPELDDGQNDTYDPEPLIDASAPIPPRALTMLASARRLSTDS